MSHTFRNYTRVIACLCFTVAASCVSYAQRTEPSEDQKIEFAKKHITLGKKNILVEIADDDAKREHGLMFRRSLAPDTGMLFIFQEETPVSFWMKNTLIPLSIGYFDAKKVLKSVYEMTPAVTGELKPRTYPSGVPVMYALEMSPKWFEQNKIKPGQRFEFAPEKTKKP